MYSVIGPDGSESGRYSGEEIIAMVLDGKLSKEAELRDLRSNSRLSAGTVLSLDLTVEPLPSSGVGEAGGAGIPGGAGTAGGSGGVVFHRPLGDGADAGSGQGLEPGGGVKREEEFTPEMPDWALPRQEAEATPKPAMAVSPGTLAIIGAGLVMCPCLIFLTLLAPVFSGSAGVGGGSVSPVDAMRDSSRAILLYAQDHGDKFPPGLGQSSQWHRLVGDYMDDPSALTPIPDSPILANPNLSAYRKTEVLAPFQTIMLYLRSPSLDGVSLMSTVDGDLHRADERELEKVVESGIFNLPPTMPMLRRSGMEGR